MVPPIIALTGTFASVAVMLYVLAKGVIRNLAAQESGSVCRLAWIDTWIPLILALPVALLALGAGPAHPTSMQVPFASVALPVAGAILVIAFSLLPALGHRALGHADLEGRHVLGLAVTGLFLLAGSVIGRIHDWQGNFLIAAAIAWLWLMSADPDVDATKSTSSQSKPVKKPLFVWDWAGGGTSSVRWPTCLILALCVLMIGLCVRSIPDEQHIAVMLIVAVWPIPVLLTVLRHAGSGDARRCACSTLIISVLLSLGALGIRLMPWLEIPSLLTSQPIPTGTVQVTGLTILLPAAVGVLVLAALAFDRSMGARRWWAVGLALASIGITLAGTTASLQ